MFLIFHQNIIYLSITQIIFKGRYTLHHIRKLISYSSLLFKYCWAYWWTNQSHWF